MYEALFNNTEEEQNLPYISTLVPLEDDLMLQFDDIARDMVEAQFHVQNNDIDDNGVSSTGASNEERSSEESGDDVSSDDSNGGTNDGNAEDNESGNSNDIGDKGGRMHMSDEPVAPPIQDDVGIDTGAFNTPQDYIHDDQFNFPSTSQTEHSSSRALTIEDIDKLFMEQRALFEQRLNISMNIISSRFDGLQKRVEDECNKLKNI